MHYMNNGLHHVYPTDAFDQSRFVCVTNFVDGDVAIGIDHSLRAAASFICDHKEKSDERRYRYPR